MDRKHRQSGSLGYFTDYRVSGKADGMAEYRRPTFQVAEPCGSLQLREARARRDRGVQRPGRAQGPRACPFLPYQSFAVGALSSTVELSAHLIVATSE
jgi:hypothetical protein